MTINSKIGKNDRFDHNFFVHLCAEIIEDNFCLNIRTAKNVQIATSFKALLDNVFFTTLVKGRTHPMVKSLTLHTNNTNDP